MNAWGNRYALLVRRELWEHKEIWVAPAVAALLMVVLPMFGNVRAGPGFDLNVSAPDIPPEMRRFIGPLLMAGLATVLGLVSALVSAVYLLDCLFAERKDRSILFWKSLPVSDTATVLSKLGLALFIVPALTLLAAFVCYGLLTGLLYLRYEHLRPAMEHLSLAQGVVTLGHLASSWLFTLLWYAPVAAYLMLASVIARRTPLVYAVLPPVALVLLESMLLDTSHVLRFLKRWTPGSQIDPASPFVGDGSVVASPDWLLQLREPDLWLGLAAAAVMVYIVIRLRRYRDDT